MSAIELRDYRTNNGSKGADALDQQLSKIVTEGMTTNDWFGFREGMHARERITAQLAVNLSSQLLTQDVIESVHQTFAGYATNEAINHIQSISQVFDGDLSKSGSDNLSYVYPNAPVETARGAVHKVTFHPATVTFHTVPEDEKGMSEVFPNHSIGNRILFLAPVVLLSYPITIHNYGEFGKKKGELDATIFTAAVRRINVWRKDRDTLSKGLWITTRRVWNYPHTDRDLARSLELSMFFAQIAQYEHMTKKAFAGGKADGTAR